MRQPLGDDPLARVELGEDVLLHARILDRTLDWLAPRLELDQESGWAWGPPTLFA
jgi:hypothetical protein